MLAVFQPHGFGPARFLRPELREMMPRLLRPQDRLCYAEIFYAGGTVARDVSSAALAADLPGSIGCAVAHDHAAVVADEVRLSAAELLPAAAPRHRRHRRCDARRSEAGPTCCRSRRCR